MAKRFLKQAKEMAGALFPRGAEGEAALDVEKLKGLQEKISDLAREERPTGGLSALDLKNMLMTNYLTNLSYYLHLKSTGAKVADHPVVDELFFLRTLLEKWRPVEGRLRYRVDKLLKQASAKAEKSSALSAENEENLKPMAGNLKLDIEDAEGDGAAEAESWATPASGDGVYKPPKISSVEYTGDRMTAVEKAEKKLEREKQRLRKSNVARELREELTGAPREVHTGVSTNRNVERIKRKRREIEEYEETNMVRLRNTKLDKKEARALKHARFTTNSGGMSLNDFGDLGDITGSNRAMGSFREKKDAVRKGAKAAAEWGRKSKKSDF